MQNKAGESVDLYVPRKCHYTSRLLVAKDHSAIQVNVGNVDPVTGISIVEYTPFCLAGHSIQGRE